MMVSIITLLSDIEIVEHSELTKNACQWIFGFFSFWWPGAETGARARLAPWHIFFGIVIFFMAILSTMTGLVEKFVFLSLQRSQEALIINFTGLLILLFAIAVGLSVIPP